tara:strand:- start:247 stop:936 length:690 start_codon:yes stop_codon:yes gene_type:complete
VFNLFRKKKLSLRNGAQNITEISTRHNDERTPQWWADTYTLSHNMSEGDRSGISGAIQISNNDTIAEIMTAHGTVNNELYHRLCCLGYLKSKPISNMPISGEIFLLTETGKMEHHLFAFLLASSGAMQSRNGDPTEIKEFCERFSGLNLQVIPMTLLSHLRYIFFKCEEVQGDETVNTSVTNLLNIFADRGIMDKHAEYIWKPTEISQFIAPFMLDATINDIISKEVLH